MGGFPSISVATNVLVAEKGSPRPRQANPGEARWLFVPNCVTTTTWLGAAIRLEAGPFRRGQARRARQDGWRVRRR